MDVREFLASSAKELEDFVSNLALDGFKPNLAIAFTSTVLDLEEMSGLFNRLEIDVIGYSTAGEIYDGALYDGVTCGLLFSLDQSHYRIFSSEYAEIGAFEAGREIGSAACGAFESPALIIGSGGISVDAEQLVSGLKAGLGGEAPIFGGLAADDLRLETTFIFTREKVTSNGVMALVLDNNIIEVVGLATSGWQGVGMENVVTKAEGNVIYTINDEPALDAFIKYFGYFDNSEVKGKIISTISAQYPLQIMRDDGSTILRSPLIGSEEERTLILAGGVRQGDRFKFSISPGFEVIDQTIEEFGDLYKEVGDVDALVLFSCKGRHAALGPLLEDEISGIYKFWRKPMTGFFTYGEIGPTKKGICEFHNETCSLVLLRERR